MYRDHISNRAATIAETLREYHYSTLAVGKWHLTPMNEIRAAGPFTNWPLGADAFTVKVDHRS